MPKITAPQIELTANDVRLFEAIAGMSSVSLAIAAAYFKTEAWLFAAFATIIIGGLAYYFIKTGHDARKGVQN